MSAPVSTTDHRLFLEAAKRFQLRAHAISGDTSVGALRAEWALRDVLLLAPLATDLEQRIFTVWNNMGLVFAVQDAEEQAHQNAAAAAAAGSGGGKQHGHHHHHHHQQSRRVAAAFLKLHAGAMTDPDVLVTTAQQFSRIAQRGGAPNEAEFRSAQSTVTMLAYCGYLTEASFLLEHMIRAVEDNSNGNGPNRNDEDDPNSFFPEERALMSEAAQLLRVPFTESVDALNRWRSRGTKLLGNLRGLVGAPSNVLGLKQLRQAVLNLLFPISGDLQVVRDFCGHLGQECGIDNNSGARALWSAAALCALAEPLASKKQICDVMQRVQSQEASGSGGGSSKCPPAGWYETSIINGVAASTPKGRLEVLETMFSQRMSAASSSALPLPPRGRLIWAMMVAHLSDLCCDLSNPECFLDRNTAVARYVRVLATYDSGVLLDVGLAYLLHSPLMNPQFAASLLVRLATASISSCEDGCGGDRAVRVYQEKMAPHCALQRALRALWRRAGGKIDWRAIEETVDGVWEGAFRDMCKRKALALWDEKKQPQQQREQHQSQSAENCDVGRVVDAVSLLVRSGNGMAAETLLREALDEFDVSKPATVQRVLLLGDAAAVGALLDPVIEDDNNGRRPNNCSGNGADDDSLTSLALCRLLSELYRAKSAVNVLDFVLPLIEDEPDFVHVAPAGVLRFVVDVAGANVGNIRTLRQHGAISLLLNMVVGMGGGASGGEVLSASESEILSTKLTRQLLRLPLDSI